MNRQQQKARLLWPKFSSRKLHLERTGCCVISQIPFHISCSIPDPLKCKHNSVRRWKRNYHSNHKPAQKIINIPVKVTSIILSLIMLARYVRRFTSVAATPLLYGSASDTSANISFRTTSNMYRSAARYLSTSSQPSKATVEMASSALNKEAPKKTFFAWYESHLQANPVPTKMVTGGFLWGLGDAVAQASSGVDHYDYPRTGRAVFFGFAIHAPTSHVHFNLLEWMTVRTGVTGLGIPVFKTIMEQVSSKTKLHLA